jgi:hypothetical protein
MEDFLKNIDAVSFYLKINFKAIILNLFSKIIKPTQHFIMGLGITSSYDVPIRTTWSEPKDLTLGEYELIFDNDDLMLTSGTYKLVIGLSTYVRTFQYIENLVSIIISDAGEIANNTRIINTQSGLILNQMNVKLTKLN